LIHTASGRVSANSARENAVDELFAGQCLARTAVPRNLLPQRHLERQRPIMQAWADFWVVWWVART
jgi:hypothetical protein